MEQKENLARIMKIKHEAEEISGQWQALPHSLVLPPSPSTPKLLHFPFSFCRRGTCGRNSLWPWDRPSQPKQLEFLVNTPQAPSSIKFQSS